MKKKLTELEKYNLSIEERKKEKEAENKKHAAEKNFVKRVSKYAALLVIAMIVLSSAVYSVPQGHAGCEFSRTNGWNYQETTQGWHLKTPFIVKATTMSFRTNTLGIHTGGEGEFSVLTPKDANGINFNVDVTLRYRLDGNQICEFMEQKGYDESPLLLTALRADSTRGVFGQYAQEDLPENRIEVAENVRKVLQARLDQEASGNLKSGYIIIEAIDIRNIGFNDRIENAIISKQERKQEAEKQTYILQQAEKEREIRLVQADAMKKATILEAEGRSQAILLEATAKAEGIDKVNTAYQNMPDQYVEVRYAEALGAIATSGNSVFMDIGRFSAGGSENIGVLNYNELIAGKIVK